MSRAGVAPSPRMGKAAAVETPAAEPLLHEVFGGVARRLRAQLTTRTGMDSPSRVAEVSIATLGSLCRDQRYSDAALWCAHAVGGCIDPAYVVFERRLLGSLMGRLFGEGKVEASPTRTGVVTEVEQVIGARMSRELTDAISACWGVSEPLVIRSGAVGRSRRVCADVDPETPYAIIELEVGADPPHGRLFVALPMTAIETLLPRRPAEKSAARVPRFERLLDVQLELVVELARLQVPLRRLHGLKVGQELPLGALGVACACVAGRQVFLGDPGTSGGLRSFRIKRRNDSPSSINEGDR